jgi:site-specific recombinase XerD
MTKIETLLGDYLSYLEVEKNRSPKTTENYKHYLGKFLKFADVASPEEITEKLVVDFRKTLARPSTGEEGRKDLKKVTQSYYVIALRNFLKFLAKSDIPSIDAEEIELPNTPASQIDILDYRDLERLLAIPKGNSIRDLRDKAILETFFSTGLRLAELCSLDRYLDLTRGEVTIRGKGDKLRIVFVAPSARKAILDYLTKRTDADPALFVSLTRSGKILGRIIPRAVERVVERRAKEAGVAKHVHVHELRHAFATDLLVNGADIRSVQELLGHANISTTQMYTHLTNQQLREVHQAFHGKRRGEKKQ